MFPLGSAVLPGGAVPLRVFEPRYLELVRRCVDGDGTFGTVLIGRGSEVGGGDARTDVGCLLRIIDVRANGDGSLELLAAAIDRLIVDTWLVDDPHPWAEVHRDPGSEPTAADIDRSMHGLNHLLELAVQLGHLPGVPPLDLPDDPSSRAWRICALSPIGPADRHELLAESDGGRRLARFREMLVEQEELLRFQGPRSE